MLVFLIGFAGTFWQWRREKAARKDEHVQRQHAELARDEAQAAEGRTAAALYSSNIVRARLQYRANNVANAENILDRCPAERRGWEWRFLKQLCHADLMTLQGHTNWVYAVAYSPDGRLLATAGGGNPFWTSYGNASIQPGEVILWDAASGARLRTLRGHKNVITTVAFSPDGKSLATGSQDDTMRLWDTASGDLLGVLPGRSRRRMTWGYGVSSVAFSPGGKVLAAGSVDKIDVCNLPPRPGKRLVPRLTLPMSPGYSTTGLAFSPDGLRLAAGYRNWGWGRVKVWDLARGVVAQSLDESAVIANGVGWSCDGRYLAAWHPGGVLLWDAASGKLVNTLGQAREFFAGAFSPAGDRLAAASTDGVVRIWSVPGGQELHVYRGHRGKVLGVAFSADGQRLASASADGTVKVWSLSQDAEHGVIETSQVNNLEAIAFADQGKRLIAVRRDGKVHTFDCEAPAGWRPRPTVALKAKWRSPAEPASLDADGRWIAGISREDSTIAGCWDAATGRERSILRGHRQALLFVTISAGGTRVATAGQPAPGAPLHTEVKVWDAAAGRPLFQFDEPNLRVTRLALSPEGNRLALAGQLITPTEEAQASWSKPVVRVYDVGTAKVVREFVGSRAVEGRDEPFHALGFSANGARLAAAGSARTVLLWDLSAAQPVVTRDGPKDAMDLTFSPNGRRLAIASRRQVKLLDVASGHEALTLLGCKHLFPDTHGFNPRVRFSPDGERLVAICHDQLFPIALWSVKYEADRDQEARLRAADRQATVAHLRLAKLYAGNPKKRAAFLFHLKHLKGVQLATPQEYAVRGLLLARAGQLDVAEPDLARARGVAWDDAPTLFKVGEAFAARGRWKQAAPYFDRYFALGRGSGWSDSRVPCLKLYLNDRAAYRRCCRQLLERHGKSTDANTILNILIWGPLLEDGAADPQLLLKMADRWLEGTEKHGLRRYMVEAKGMAEYRAGRFERAVAWLQKAEPMANYHYHKAGIFFFLSMACQRLNRGDEAKAAYQQGLRHIEIHFGSRDNYQPGKGHWSAWPWSQVLRREAEAVLKNARVPDKPQK